MIYSGNYNYTEKNLNHIFSLVRHLTECIELSPSFEVNNQTGEVRVAVAANEDHSLLDRETEAVHYMALEAVDGGGLRTSVQLQVVLSDVNDNAPIISRMRYDGFINENEADMERPLVVEVRYKILVFSVLGICCIMSTLKLPLKFILNFNFFHL